MEYNRVVAQEILSKKELYEALDYLRIHHPSYSDVVLLGQDKYDESMQCNVDTDEDSLDSDTGDKDETDNPYLNVTCLQPDNPESNIIINTSSEPLRKRRKLTSNIVHDVAPGEAKVH